MENPSVHCFLRELDWVKTPRLLLPGIMRLTEFLDHSQSSKNYVQVNKYGRIKAKWILFAILAGCQLMAAAFMWPGGFPADAIDQLNQAVGARVLNDWHPVLHTLIERVIVCVFHNMQQLK